MTSKTLGVAKYLERQLALCGRSQRDIATELGYANPNMITMFKQGRTRVPYAMIGRLAAATDSDPAFLVRLVLGEYDPDLLATIETVLADGLMLSVDERELVALAREASGGLPVDVHTPHCRDALASTISAVAANGRQRADASVRALNRIPKSLRGTGRR